MTAQQHLEQCKSLQQQTRQIRKDLKADNQSEPESIRRFDSDLTAWIAYAENKTHQPTIQKALQNFTYKAEDEQEGRRGSAVG